MANEFIIKNGLVLNNSNSIVGITSGDTELTFNEHTLVSEYAIKKYIGETTINKLGDIPNVDTSGVGNGDILAFHTSTDMWKATDFLDAELMAGTGITFDTLVNGNIYINADINHYSLPTILNDNSIHKISIGTEISGHTEIREDGTVRLKGEATSWKDMVGDLFGKSLKNRGTVDYDWINNTLKFQKQGSFTDANNFVGTNLQINHDFKIGNSISFKPHIHWFQKWTTGSGETYKLDWRWRLQRNNFKSVVDDLDDLTQGSWNTGICYTGNQVGSSDIFDFSSEDDGYYNQLSRFPEITVDCNVSDTFQYQVTRKENVAGSMFVYFIDFHGMVDSFGSDEEVAKAE